MQSDRDQAQELAVGDTALVVLSIPTDLHSLQMIRYRGIDVSNFMQIFEFGSGLRQRRFDIDSEARQFKFIVNRPALST